MWFARDAALTFSKAAADVIRSFTIDGASSASYTAPTTKGAHTVVVNDTDIAPGDTATDSISFTLSKSTAPAPTPDPTPGGGSDKVTASYVLQGVVPKEIAAAPFDVAVGGTSK